MGWCSLVSGLFRQGPARRRSGSFILMAGPPSSRPCLSGEMQRSYHVPDQTNKVREGGGGRKPAGQACKRAGVGGPGLVGRASPAEPAR